MRIMIRFKLDGTEAVGAITMVGREAEAITMAGGIAADRERVLAALVAAFFPFRFSLGFPFARHARDVGNFTDNSTSTCW
jgi:hypothetical protein